MFSITGPSFHSGHLSLLLSLYLPILRGQQVSLAAFIISIAPKVLFAMPSNPPSFPAPLSDSTVSRSWLRQLTAWIRDDLDILIAREGPNILRPDDVLVLHETFVA